MKFTVCVAKMTESHRVTYWVHLSNSENGIITPSYHENLEHAEEEAKAYADFLGVAVEPHSYT